MVGDVFLSIFMFVLFVIEIVVGVIIINSSSGLTPMLRKSDNNLAIAYDQYNIAGQISLYTGIIGVIIVFISWLILGFKPNVFDNIPRTGKITIKLIFGLIIVVLTSLVSYYMYQASNSILISRTYTFSRFGAKQEFDSSIYYTQMTASFYILLAVIFFTMFVAMGFYDYTKKPIITIDTLITY